MLFRINLSSKLPNSTYMEVTCIVMSFYLCCVFFSFEAHRKLVNGPILNYLYIFPILAVNTVTGNSISTSYHSGLSPQFMSLSSKIRAKYDWFWLDAFRLPRSISCIFRGRRFKG
nr:MAG TPA: hypothetical protein [Caudoviricetes sp.]